MALKFVNDAEYDYEITVKDIFVINTEILFFMLD